MAIVCDKEEIIHNNLVNAIPKRTSTNRGPVPGPAYWDDDLRETNINGKKMRIEKWIKANEPSKKEGQIMVSLMLEKAVEVVMKNHTYRFDGKM